MLAVYLFQGIYGLNKICLAKLIHTTPASICSNTSQLHQFLPLSKYKQLQLKAQSIITCTWRTACNLELQAL